MASPRKKSPKKPSKKELRRRALKGWETRRKRELPGKIENERKLIENARKVTGKKPRKKKVKPNPRISADKLQKMLAKERAARKKAEKDIRGIAALAREQIDKRVTEALAIDRAKAKMEADERKRISKLRADAQAQNQAIIEQMTAHFVPTRVTQPEWLHQNMTLALYPSRLRWHKDSMTLRELMYDAERKGDHALEILADRIAEAYNVPIQEVYTLHMSP